MSTYDKDQARPVLRFVLEHLRMNPGLWGQRGYHLDEDGHSVPADAGVTHCAVGLAEWAAFRLHGFGEMGMVPDYEHYAPAVTALVRAKDRMDGEGQRFSVLTSWNDRVERTVEDIMDLYENALADATS